MPREFNIGATRSTFQLAPHVRKRIVGLMLDLGMTATDVVERAIIELWQREMGEPERDVLAELDDLKQRIATLERGHYEQA